MENKNDLSVIVLTKNEAKIISKCLISVKLLQPLETLVIDDNSTDYTVKMAADNEAKIFIHRKKDFAEARNYGAAKAIGKWILYIDADEIVTSQLADEINQVIKVSHKAGYKIIRENYYLGKKWPTIEALERLFEKSKLVYWYGSIHESPKVNGDIGKLSQKLQHFTHRSLSEMVDNTLIWSGIEANLRYSSHHPPITWWRIPRVMLPVFWV